MSRARTDSSANPADTGSTTECWLVTRIGSGYASSGPAVRTAVGAPVLCTAICTPIGTAVRTPIAAPVFGSCISATIGTAVRAPVGAPVFCATIGATIGTAVRAPIGSAVAGTANTEPSGTGIAVSAAIPDTRDSIGTMISRTYLVDALVGTLRGLAH